jgi:hypothetical protein
MLPAVWPVGGRASTRSGPGDDVARIAGLIVSLALAGALAASCAGPPASRAGATRPAAHTSIPTMSCVHQPVAHAPLPQEVGVYHAGPLVLAVGQDLAQHPDESPWRRTSGSEAIAVLTGSQAVILSVDPRSRGRLSLAFPGPGPKHSSPVISDGLPAMRLPVCEGRVHRFGGGITYEGSGCARLNVTQAGQAPIPMLIPIGNTLRGCPSPSPLEPLGASATPFLGVSCSVPNSIACDRIGIGVHVSRAATLVVARVDGRLVTLSPPPGPPPGDLWLGYLDGAGLRHGPLNVHISRAARLWYGTPEVWARLRVTAFFRDGRAESLSTTVLLHAGFG